MTAVLVVSSRVKIHSLVHLIVSKSKFTTTSRIIMVSCKEDVTGNTTACWNWYLLGGEILCGASAQAVYQLLLYGRPHKSQRPVEENPLFAIIESQIE